MREVNVTAYLKGFRFNSLLSVWFVSALTLLLLNDYYLKATYHNWITGKLSDFTGLFIFVIFWSSVFQGRKLVVVVATAVLFVLWKLPLSEPIIISWNQLGVWSVARVPDRSDLLALAVLPVAYVHHGGRQKGWLSAGMALILCMVTVGAMLGTSRPRPDGIDFHPIPYVDYYLSVSPEKVADVLNVRFPLRELDGLPPELARRLADRKPNKVEVFKGADLHQTAQRSVIHFESNPGNPDTRLIRADILVVPDDRGTQILLYSMEDEDSRRYRKPVIARTWNEFRALFEIRVIDDLRKELIESSQPGGS